jgi:hypothetical protein
MQSIMGTYFEASCGLLQELDEADRGGYGERFSSRSRLPPITPPEIFLETRRPP